MYIVFHSMWTIETYKQTAVKKDRQSDRQTDGWTDILTQEDRKIDIQTEIDR